AHRHGRARAGAPSYTFPPVTTAPLILLATTSPNTKPATLPVSVASPETVFPEKSVPAWSPVITTSPVIRLPGQSPVAGSPTSTGAVPSLIGRSPALDVS